MILKPIVTEKAVMKIESQNVLTFQTGKENTKEEIKKEIETLFGIKIQSIRIFIRGNKKYAYVRLKSQYPAIDVATKLGVI